MKKNQLLIDIMIILGISTILAFWFNGLSNPNAISLIREKQVLEIANDDEFEQINTGSAISSDTLPIKELPKDTLPIKKDSAKSTPTTQQITSANDGNKSVEDQGPVKAKAVNYVQVKKLLADPSVMVIDARNEHEFAEGHLPKARNIFAMEFQQYIPELIGMNKDIRIIVYCGGGQCELSHELSNNLIGLGFKKVYIYLGGWDDWKQNGSGK
jgi:rhodanese-related sulfurtransferase